MHILDPKIRGVRLRGYTMQVLGVVVAASSLALEEGFAVVVGGLTFLLTGLGFSVVAEALGELATGDSQAAADSQEPVDATERESR